MSVRFAILSMLCCILFLTVALRVQVRERDALRFASAEIAEGMRYAIESAAVSGIQLIPEAPTDPKARGWSFKSGTCADRYVAIRFGVRAVLEHSLADAAEIPRNPTTEIHYAEQSLKDAGRLRLTAAWLLLKLGYPLGLTDISAPSDAIAVVVPKGCAPPEIDWSPAWDCFRRIVTTDWCTPSAD